MKRNLPIILTLAALVAPTAAFASAADNQYSDPYGSAPTVKHHTTKHKKKHKTKKHTVKRSSRKH